MSMRMLNAEAVGQSSNSSKCMRQVKKVNRLSGSSFLGNELYGFVVFGIFGTQDVWLLKPEFE